jgi:phosphohistidine phosphatase SixA
MKLYIVRHADAGDRATWTRPDQLRPLSDKGWRQARALVDMLPAVERLLSSRYLRCRQTLEPLARRLGLTIENEERLVEGTPLSEVLHLFSETTADAAMCTQGDIVEALVDHLLRQGLVPPEQAGSSKASTWSLDVEAGQIASATYISPPV